MSRWIAIPILGCMLIGGATQAAQTTPEAKPTAAVTAPSHPTASARRRVTRAPVQESVAPSPVYETPSYSGRALRPSPSDPYSGVTLPRQSGDAAYQGGGVVLEQDGDGVNRRVR